MPIAMTLVTPPASEPVTLAEAKARLRVDTSDEDADITLLIAEAREAAEAECGCQFMAATWALYLDSFPGYAAYPCIPGTTPVPTGGVFDAAIRLPRPPCQSVISVKYYDAAGVQQTLSGATYFVAVAGFPARLVPVPGQWWPPTQWGRPEAVEIRFVAGYPTAADVPAVARAAILEIVAHRWANRGDESKLGIPAVARRLLDAMEFGEVW